MKYPTIMTNWTLWRLEKKYFQPTTKMDIVLCLVHPWPLHTFLEWQV